MSDADLWASFRFWLVVATVIVLVAASLLVAIWLTARKILGHAVRALEAGERIRSNTQPLWALESTNEVATELVATVRSIEAKGGALGAALSRTAGREGDQPSQGA